MMTPSFWYSKYTPSLIFCFVLIFISLEEKCFLKVWAIFLQLLSSMHIIEKQLLFWFLKILSFEFI